MLMSWTPFSRNVLITAVRYSKNWLVALTGNLPFFKLGFSSLSSMGGGKGILNGNVELIGYPYIYAIFIRTRNKVLIHYRKNLQLIQ
ncbi:unnamed protein product [Rhizophagus irregularis]|nr:unnamed protein product [Rhizophagus irregularis]